jgi:hypothetical protein
MSRGLDRHDCDRLVSARGTDPDPRAFFDDALVRAETAVASCGALVRDLVLAGRHIRLIFAGPALEGLLMPAIDHLRAEWSGEADFVCYVWDSKSSGVQMAPAPVASNSFCERGDIAGFDGENIFIAFQPSDYSLSLFDADARVGFFWLEDAQGLPYWTQAAPFRTLFHWWVEHSGGVLVHGAAIANEDGGILIAGKGGTGKSTTALACVAAGFSYVGDDYVAIYSGTTVTAHSLYCTAKLNPDNSGRFGAFRPRLLGEAAIRGEGKMVAFLPRASRGGVTSSIVLTAIATPSFADCSETAIVRADPAALLLAAAATSLAQLPRAGLATIDRIARIVDRLPGYAITLGTVVDEIPAVIARVLRDPAQPRHQASDFRGLPFLSLIVHVEEDAALLADTFADILAQGCPRLEAIVVDGGAVAIEALIETLPFQPRIVRVEGLDPAAPLNLETVAAAGEVVAVVRAGDRWMPGMLRTALELLRDDPEVDVVAGQSEQHMLPPGGGTVFRRVPCGGVTMTLPGPLLRPFVRAHSPGDARHLALGLARQALRRKRAIAS